MDSPKQIARAPDPGVTVWQDRLTPLWERIGGGCHLNRRIDEMIKQAGFQIPELTTSYIPGPRPMTYTYQLHRQKQGNDRCAITAASSKRTPGRRRVDQHASMSWAYAAKFWGLRLAGRRQHTLSSIKTTEAPGLGKRKAEESQVAELERKIGEQTLEIDFLKRVLQRVEEARMLQDLDRTAPSTSRSTRKRNGKKP